MSNRFAQNFKSHPASFKDPNGYIVEHDGILYRLVQEVGNTSENLDYKKLMESGLYGALTQKNWLITHEEVTDFEKPSGCSVILRPEQLPLISYPWEWSFGQLQEAALLTLDIQSKALDLGMTLKDASAFNTIWHNGKPIFIDTLSFTAYEDGTPWQGYGQFCSHFLAPLALMQYQDMRLQKLFQTDLNGIPLDMASKLLPWRTRFNFSLGLHIHMHARSQKKYSNVGKKVSAKLSLKQCKNIIISLRNTVEALKPNNVTTEWGDYYNDTNYTQEKLQEKKDIVSTWIKQSQAQTILDLGANDGTFSRIASETASLVISVDIDQTAVHSNYLRCKADENNKIIPILLDITNPSAGVGWHCKERDSIFERIQADLGMALALVHHLTIGANIPLDLVFQAFADMAPNWIVEFVDKSDTQVRRLLANREDIFPNYTKAGFEEAATTLFEITTVHNINDMHRTLYFLKKKVQSHENST